MKVKKVLLMFITLIMLFVFVGCDSNKNINDNLGSGDSNVTINKDEKKKSFFETKDINRYKNVENNPIVSMEMDSGEIIKIELYPQIAPEAVENFIELINEGFYNGLTFHRVIPGFMIQGGDPNGNGSGGPDYSIYGEFSSNGFENSLKHTRGVLSMARSNENNSAGSQFFIMVADDASLDGQYAAFGKVIEGMDIVDKIVNSEVIRTDYSDEFKEEVSKAGGVISTIELYAKYIDETSELDRPVEPPVIKSITVDTFGIEYSSPSKIEVAQ